MKRAVVVWLLCGGLSLVVGCTCSRRRASPGDGGAAPRTIRAAMEAEPPTLNPLVEHDAWTTWIMLNGVAEPVVAQDPASGAFLPALAARFAVEEDRAVRLWLREGVAWHDGRPFGAGDVVATLDRVRDAGSAAAQRADFAALDTIERVGANELVLRFREPTPLALQSLAHLPILPAHLFPAAATDLRALLASRAPIGTGPLRFISWQPGVAITLARNEGWWGRAAVGDGGSPGAAAGLADRIVLQVVPDREAAWELARRGELDVLWRLTPAQIDRPPPPGFRVQQWAMPSYLFVVWNLRRPGLGDRRVRQALALLADKERYLQAAYRGRARPISGPYPLASPSYDTTILPWPHDPARAKVLLDQAGVIDRDGDGLREAPGAPGQPLRIELLLAAGSKSAEPLATMMQEDFRRAGIDLVAVPTEWGTLLDRLRKHDFGAAIMQWNMQPVQDNWFEFHSTEAERGQNYGNFRHPDADRLLEQLRRTPPGEARVRLDHSLHRLLHEEQPYLFLACPAVESLLSLHLSGYTPSQDGLGLPGWGRF